MSRRSRNVQIDSKPGQEHRKELVRLIKEASYMHSTWHIWEDLMFFAASALAQPTRWSQKREDEYMRRFGSYDKKTQELFPMMVAEIIMAYEDEGFTDILGDIYMQLELFNKWKGQYFTPSHICDCMARMACDDLATLVEQRGYVSVNDPTCGAGAMLIAAAKVAHEQGVNYQKDVLFVGQDIDPVVAHMCYISMSLFGMPGYVIVGNTLLMDKENWDWWFTPVYFINGFQWRRQREAMHDSLALITVAVGDEETTHIETPEQEETLPQATEQAVTLAVEYISSAAGQLALF